MPAIREWVALGRPLIARRPVSGAREGMVPLGLPLPPSICRQRLVITVPPEWVMAWENPPLLSDAMTVAPPAWHRTIAALVEVDRDVRCFGSLAWEYLTGLTYLSDTSDLDLLWQVPAKGGADGVVAAIARIEAEAPVRIDGELLTPAGLAIQWREWTSGTPHLLAKAGDGARLVAQDSVVHDRAFRGTYLNPQTFPSPSGHDSPRRQRNPDRRSSRSPSSEKRGCAVRSALLRKFWPPNLACARERPGYGTPRSALVRAAESSHGGRLGPPSNAN